MIQHRNIALYIILSIAACGFFSIYWFKCITDDTNEAASYNTGIIYLLLCLFGLSIVAYALMQNELNKLSCYS